MKEQLKEYYCFNDYIMECPVLKGKAAFLKGKKNRRLNDPDSRQKVQFPACKKPRKLRTKASFYL